MDKYFLCTLGTSIANGLKDVLWSKQKAPGDWDERDETFEKALDGLVSAAIHDKNSIFRSCAEASVLHKAGADAGDRVVLLATDNGLSRICGAAAKRVLVAGFGFSDTNVELVRVPGLQVSDAARLRREGLPGFVKAVVTRIEANQSAYETFLCPVGGYKGIVPFLTVLGMAYRLPVLYTFEFIDSLVRLPPLPFSLDRDLYARAKDALREIGSRIEMPEREFLSKIKGYSEEERDAFLAFVEPSSRPGLVTSSAFTEVFAPGFECESAPVSQKALNDLEILSHGQLYRTACRLILDLQDPVVRRGYRGNHKKTASTDLAIVKQGDTSLRIFGYESQGRFFVCRVFDHEDYERKLDSRSCMRASFPPETFDEWTPPPEGIPDSVKDEESPYDAAMRMLADSERKLADTISEWAVKVNEQRNARVEAEKGFKTIRQNFEREKQARKAAEKGLQATQQDYEKARNAIDREKAEVERLRSLVADSQRRVDELASGADAERQAAIEENERLRNRLAAAEEASRKAERDHLAKYEDAIRQIADLRRKLRAAQTRIAMTPQDAAVVQEANREIVEKKEEFARALETLLLSDKTELPSAPSDVERELRTENRKLQALLAAKSRENEELGKENESLSTALRISNEHLSAIRCRGFFARLARVFLWKRG